MAEREQRPVQVVLIIPAELVLVPAQLAQGLLTQVLLRR
jgi:hypothetical protein